MGNLLNSASQAFGRLVGAAKEPFQDKPCYCVESKRNFKSRTEASELEKVSPQDISEAISKGSAVNGRHYKDGNL